MSHITMFTYSVNDQGCIQIVTNAVNKKELESIGFVDSVDKVKAPVKKVTTKAKKNA